MKDWINRHLNWTLAIIAVAIPALAGAIISVLAGTPGEYVGMLDVFWLIQLGLVLPVSCLLVLNAKGRSGWWILLYPVTLFIIPLLLSNKNTGQQESQTSSRQTP